MQPYFASRNSAEYDNSDRQTAAAAARTGLTQGGASNHVHAAFKSYGLMVRSEALTFGE